MENGYNKNVEMKWCYSKTHSTNEKPKKEISKKKSNDSEPNADPNTNIQQNILYMQMFGNQ